MVILSRLIERRAHTIPFILMGIGLTSGLYMINIKYFAIFTLLDLTPINYPDLDFPLSPEMFTYVKIYDVIGYVIFFMMFSNVTGLTSDQIIFLPLGSVILPLGYYLLSKSFLNNYYDRKRTLLLASILTVYVIFDTYTGTIYTSVFKYALNYFLMFLFLLLYMRRDDNTGRMLALILIFISMNMIHYTVPFLTMLIVITDYVALAVKGKYSSPRLFLLPVMLICIFIISNIHVAESYFTEWRVGGEDKILKALNAIQSYIFSGSLKSEYIIYQNANDLTAFLKSVRALIITIPIAAYFIANIINYIMRKPIMTVNGMTLGILLASIAHPLLYVNIGSISVNSPTQILFFPLISTVLLTFIRLKDRVSTAYVLVLVAVVLLAYFPYLNDINYTDLYNSIMIDRTYFLPKMDLGNEMVTSNVLSDARVKALYSLEVVKYSDKKMFTLNISEETYASLINGNGYHDISYRYAILPINNKPMFSVWDNYQPANKYVDKINSNTELNRIDQTGVIVIYQNNGKSSN